ncbi:MAG: hypothetical protein HQ517_13210 [SAR324 cluster bacterium]|nr:hypothetical protein [SAR324 cluster bacterium]
MAELIEKQLEQFRRLITKRTGLRFLKTSFKDFERLLKPAFQELGLTDLKTGLEQLLSLPLGSTQFQVLVNHLTIGETYFFRNRPVYQALEQWAIPDLIRRKNLSGKRLKIWSAACSTGEEPYSIAILLKRMIPDLKNWALTILATDINSFFIKKATEGIYREWSFRNVPAWLKPNYFSANGQNFEVKNEIKNMVSFGTLNLKDYVLLSSQPNTQACDVIFCQNALMYLSSDTVDKIIDRFHQSLTDEGILIVSPGDGGQLINQKFTALTFPGTQFFQKKKRRPLVPVAYPLNQNSVQHWNPSTDIDNHALFIAPDPVKPQEENRATAIESDGDSEEIQTIRLMAKTCANQGELDKAKQWCEKGLAINKLDLDLYYLQAIIYQETGDLERAIAALEKTLYIEPEFVLAYFSLGHLSKQINRPHEARRHYESALGLLNRQADEEIVPESGGLSVKELRETIQLILGLPGW